MEQAEALRRPAAGAVDPTPAHWENLRLSLYQLMLWTDPACDPEQVMNVHCLDPYASHLIASAPFFHPTPLACMKTQGPVAMLLQKCVPNRCQLRSRK